MAKRSASSHQWLQRHVSDEYVKRAQRDGYRSRAAYKLQEIDQRDKILRSGLVVVDLGATPGGWSQVAVKKTGSKGRVFALDILPMVPLENVVFIEGDFREESVMVQLLSAIENQGVDLVMSDMAPNISGLKAVDQPKAMYLAELAMEFARQRLKPGGDFLVKVFQGEGFDEFCREMRQNFDKVVTRKPKASRAESREVYLLGLGYKAE